MSTMIDLRGRHLMKLADFSPEEITYLIDLAAELKAAKKEGREEQKLVGKEIALIFEKDSTQDALRVRGRRLRPGRPRHLHRPGRLAHGPQGDGEGHGPRARPHVRRDRVPRLRAGHRRGARRAGPASRSTTASPTSGTRRRSSPTSSPSASTSPKPLDEVVFCYLGDARFNMADSYLVGGAKLGMDVRIASPKSLWPRDEIVELAHSIADETGATITITEDVAEAVRGADVLLTDVWVSMGEAGRGLGGADRAAQALPGQRRDDGGDRQPGREVHALPARVPQHRDARSARRSSRSSGWRRSR